MSCYVYEWCNAPQFNPRGGLVSIRTYPTEQEAREDCAKLKVREDNRRARYHTDSGHTDPFPRYFVVSNKKRW